MQLSSRRYELCDTAAKRFGKLDERQKEIVRQYIAKIAQNPQIEKPMRYARKGTREIYVSSFRLSYILDDDTLIIADLYHKGEQ